MDGLRSRIPGLKIEWSDGWAPSDDECDDYGGGCYGYGGGGYAYGGGGYGGGGFAYGHGGDGYGSDDSY